MGIYINWINMFTHGASGQCLACGRSQLLVLSFEQLIADTALALQQLTTHYGLPSVRATAKHSAPLSVHSVHSAPLKALCVLQVLARAQQLPDSNAHDSPAKLIAIRCSTRALADEAYRPFNEKLDWRLALDRSKGHAPPTELPFPPFDATDLPCEPDRERTMSDLSELELRSHFNRTRHRTPSAAEIDSLLKVRASLAFGHPAAGASEPAAAAAVPA